MIIAKSRTLEIRTSPVTGGVESQQLLPLVTTVPIHGRIVSLHALPWQQSRSLIFVTTDRWQYAVLGYDEDASSPYPIVTHASGSLSATNMTQSVILSSSSTPGGSGSPSMVGNNDGPPLLGREAETGPVVAVHSRCIVLHIFEGILTVLPINPSYEPRQTAFKTSGAIPTTTMTPPRYSASSSFLQAPFHCRVEERTILALTFVPVHVSTATGSPLPLLSVLYQDARGVQNMTTHMIHVGRQQLYLHGSSNVPTHSAAWWKKSAVDGGSALMLPVPPRVPAAVSVAAGSSRQGATATVTTGGVLIVGQRQLTYSAPQAPTKIIPVPQALYLAATELPPDPDGGGLPRYLLADEFGNLHMLSIMVAGPAESPTNQIQGLQLETLGSCNLATALTYLGQGLVFVGSAMGDSQLVQIHDEPFSEQGPLKKDVTGDTNEDDDDEDLLLLETTYLQVLEEFPNLGPILDFDLIPTTLGGGSTSTGATNPGNAMSPKEAANQLVVPSQVVTASGSSKSGTIRLIRNGIGMKESASVEIPGISQMWSLRQSFGDSHDTYLVQSFVGETRVLGIVETNFAEEIADDDRMEEDNEGEVGGALEEVLIPGMDSTVPTLYMGNLEAGDRWLQITPRQIRLLKTSTPNAIATGDIVLDAWDASSKSDLIGTPLITVATANEAGQVAVAFPGGYVFQFCTTKDKIHFVSEQKMEQEVSCLDLHPFHKPSDATMTDDETPMAAEESRMLAVGLWDDFTVRLLSLENQLEQLLKIRLQEESDAGEDESLSAALSTSMTRNHRNQMMMARSLCLVTLDFSGGANGTGPNAGNTPGVDMLFVGLGDGTLISFAVVIRDGRISVQAKKEVCLGTQRIDLVPLSTNRGGTCVMATGDRPTVIYLAGVSGSSSANQVNPKLCYSNVNLSPSDDDDGEGVLQQTSEQSISVNCASPFFSPLLFDSEALDNQHYSLCVADDTSLKLGIIDDIQKLHVTTCRLGMAPRRIVHCPEGRLFAVGCVESGIKHVGLGGPETNSMSNCIRFMDDTTFEDIDRVDLEPYETILSMAYVSLKIPQSPDISGETHRRFLIVGTAYVLPDEDEPSRGKILLYSCEPDGSSAGSKNRQVRPITELFTQGAVYSICQFYHGTVLCTINTKTMLVKLVDDTGVPRLQFLGTGHHGHILSYSVRSMAEPSTAEAIEIGSQQSMSIEGAESKEEEKEMLAIVGDLMRSIGLVQYYPEHTTLEEVARDFNPNWTTAIEMLTEDVYLGAENWGNFFCLRRNKAATSEEVRFRLDSIGEFNLGEMCNKFMRGSLVMPVSASNNSGSNRRTLRRTGSPQKSSKDSAKAAATPRMQRPAVVTGSQTLFGTADGTLGVVLGLDSRTAAFFACLEKAMSKVIHPVGDFRHDLFRSCKTERRTHPAHGFVDGDLVETFVDLDRHLMESVVKEMNRDGSWEVDDVAMRSDENNKEAENENYSTELTVDDVLSMVEEISMLH